MCAFLSEQQQSHHRLLWLGQAGEGEVGSPSRIASPSLRSLQWRGEDWSSQTALGKVFFSPISPELGCSSNV